jgi:large subunit ribosomal protein L24
MSRIKKDDIVAVLTGRDRGKVGTVIETLPKKGKIKIEGVAVVTRHTKARRQGETSGIFKKETFIDMSNVMPVCSSCKKPCRVGARLLEDGKKVRTCKRCEEIV